VPSSTSSAAGGSSCDLREVVTEAVDLVAPGGCCVVDLPEDTRLGVPPVLALRALTPLVENATRLGEHVQISAAAGSAGSVSIRVDDDGPGVEASRRESIFSPGHTTGPGSGLGLALSRRIARSLGGDVTLDIDHPTTRFVLRLPQA